MTIYSAPGGIVRYAWQTTDWTTPPVLPVGVHSMEYEVVGVDGRLTFPNNRNDTLVITEDLG